MNQTTPKGILVSGSQRSETAKQDFERLASKVSSGEVEGRIVAGEQADEVEGGMSSTDARLIRRGMAWGAGAGFLLGLMPLLASTLMGAAIGGLMAKASQLRVDKGSPPRLRFARYRD